MKNENGVAEYLDAERNCPICNEPLPAHQTWPGTRYRFCMKPECVERVKKLRKSEYIESQQRNCNAPGCGNHLPEGRYDCRSTKLYCSGSCWSRFFGHAMVKCDCECDQLFYRKKPRNGLEPIFLSPKHEGRYYQNLRLAEACGEFKNLVDEYLWGFASYHYRNLSYPRSALRLFFHFLNRQGVKLLEEVTTSTITQYLIWARKSKSRVGPSDVSAITVFFDWLIAEGRRTAANPVVSKIHQPRTKNRLPRPLGPQELEFAWRLLNERGNPRLRFAAAAAEEAGLRIGEICNLRLQDVDPLRQRFFVRLPNKTNQERWAFFGEKTKRLYIEWMAVRGQNCGHDFVIHSLHGRPMRAGTLGPEFRRILCKTFDGEQVNEIGFDSWSTHRLRHNMASNLVSGGADAATVMASGGWRSCQAMTRYVRVDTRVVRHDYAHAMQRFRETKQSSVEKKVLTPAELLDRFAQPDHLFDEGALQAWVANAE